MECALQSDFIKMNILEVIIREILGSIVIAAAFFLPMIVAGFVLYRLKRKYADAASEPFKQLPLRPPGESLRLEIDRMSEKFDDHLLTVAATAAGGCMLTITAPSSLRGTVGALAFAIVVAVTFWQWQKLKMLVRRLWDFRLGFKGERVVGEELNQLLASGFKVFHDVPFEGFNIDHVLVGTPGLYAIETKTRRKPADIKGQEKATVTFDGETLLFPKGYRDRDALDQARRNARTLAEWLTKATGERVLANAILTLPGWWVARKTVADVNVLNPEEIKHSFPNQPRQPLSPEQVQRIAHQLTQRCRLTAKA